MTVLREELGKHEKGRTKVVKFNQVSLCRIQQPTHTKIKHKHVNLHMT